MRSSSMFFLALSTLLSACPKASTPVDAADARAADAAMDAADDALGFDDIAEVDAGEDAGAEAGPDAPSRCPSALEFRVEDVTIAVGSSGAFHNETATPGATFTLEVEDCDEGCNVCSVRGPIQNAGASNSFRCTHDPVQECSMDADCEETDPDPDSETACRSVWDIRGVDNGIIPSCNVSYFENNPDEMDHWGVRGEVYVNSGTVRLSRFNLTTNVRFGLCPGCGGELGEDIVCDSGANQGELCGVSSVDENSFDCPPGIPASAPGAPTPVLRAVAFTLATLNIPIAPLSTDGVVWSNPTGVCESGPCFCGACSDDDSIGCRSNADCDGTCAFPEAPNDCTTGICDAETCTSSEGQPTACFPNDVLSVPGRVQRLAGVEFRTVLGGLTCFGSASDGINGVVGFPGPGRFSIGLIMRKLF